MVFQNLINRFTKAELDDLYHRVRTIPASVASANEGLLMIELEKALEQRKDDPEDPQISEMPWRSNG